MNLFLKDFITTDEYTEYQKLTSDEARRRALQIFAKQNFPFLVYRSCDCDVLLDGDP